MLTRASLTILAVVVGTLLAAWAAALLMTPDPGLHEYASMVIGCAIAVGVIGGSMVAGGVAFRRSDDIHVRLVVYPIRPDLEQLDRYEGERGAWLGVLVFVSALIAGAIGVGLSSLA